MDAHVTEQSWPSGSFSHVGSGSVAARQRLRIGASVLTLAVALMLALGNVARADTPTETWEQPVLAGPSSGGGATAIGCESASVCITGDAVGDLDFVAGGVTAGPFTLEPGVQVMSISCTASFCMAVDDDGQADEFQNGAFGTPVQVDSEGATASSDRSLDSVSCTSAGSGFCMAISETGQTFDFNGTTWASTGAGNTGQPNFTFTYPDAVLNNTIVSCAPGTKTCIAVANVDPMTDPPTDDLYEYASYNGSTWIIPTTGTGLNKKIVTFGSDTTLSEGNGPVDGLTCLTTTECVLTTDDGYGYFYNGSAWTSDPGNPILANNDNAPGLFSSCVPGAGGTGIFCLGAGQIIGQYITSTDGKTWSAQMPEMTDPNEAPPSMNAVSCVSPTLCVGGAGNYPALTWLNAPTLTTPPSVPTSALTVGQPVTVTQGAWTNSPVTISDQWRRCEQANGGDGSACDLIDGATSTSYTTTPDDAGEFLDVFETASTAFYITPMVQSNLTAQVGGGSCPSGETGTPPDCTSSGGGSGPTGTTGGTNPTTCPSGETGTPPNCSTPAPATCPAGETGTPPNCATPPATTCPAGETGTPPNCATPTSLPGTVGSPTVSGTTLTIPVTCPADSSDSCTVSFTLSVTKTETGSKVTGVAAKAKPKAKPKKVTVTVGSGSVAVAVGQSGSATVALNGTGKTLLAKFHHLPANLTATQGSVKLSSVTVHFSAPKQTKKKKK